METASHVAPEGQPLTQEQQLARVLEEGRAALALDEANRQKLEVILKRVGWPPVQRVGRKACSAAFLIVQHAGLEMQQRYLPALHQAVAEHQTDASFLALLEDRVNIREGKAQVYGSQASTDGGVVTLQLPVDDPAHLDERRATVGLSPICEYLRGFNAGTVVWPSCVADGGVGGSAL